MRDGARGLHYAFFPSIQPSANEPLLLLNSLATTTQIWAPLLPRLTEVADVLCMDYPGHGFSPARRVPSDLDALAVQVMDAVDASDATRVHVAGVSIGGMTALRLAELFPDRISSITVIGSAPCLDSELWKARKSLVSDRGTRSIVASVLARWFTPEYSADHPEVVREYAKMLEGTADAAYATYCDVLAAADLRGNMSGISCPALVVSGTRDDAASVEEGRTIASEIPGGRLAVIEGAAHMLQAMAPARIADLIIENVRRVKETALDQSPS